jgi:hypothetical protein
MPFLAGSAKVYVAGEVCSQATIRDPGAKIKQLWRISGVIWVAEWRSPDPRHDFMHMLSTPTSHSLTLTTANLLTIVIATTPHCSFKAITDDHLFSFQALRHFPFVPEAVVALGVD